jgi:hypothetical protein
VRKYQTVILLISSILFLSIGFTSASAEILNPRMVHAIMSHLISVYGKTYSLQVDNKTFTIYYGSNFTYANATNILLVPDHNSMQISLKDVTESDAMWIQFPQNLISAENNNYVLYVDGQEKKYEYATSGHSIIMGFMVPTNATLVEIQGTHVVPEFPFAVIILIIGTIVTLVITRIKWNQISSYPR